MQRSLSVIAASALVMLAARTAGAETFDFEDLPAGTIMQAQYGPRGVLFLGAAIDTDPHAASGTRVLRSVPPGTEVFTPGPLVMNFTSPKTHVAFVAENFTGWTGQGTLRVFGSNGTVLAQDGPKVVPADVFTASFDVRVPTATIVRAEFQIDGTAFESIDNLVVDGTTTTGPNTPPVVTFTSPPDGTFIVGSSAPLRGTVTGDGLLGTVTLSVVIGLPGDSTAPPSNNVLDLTGTGTTRTFSLDYGIIPGTYTVTALATNISNLTGTATVHFASLPDAIQTRFNASGGAATFGTLRFVASETGCVAAVYDKGLIAAVGPQTFVVLGSVFQKWMSLRETGATMSKLGCPSAEERDAFGGTRAQDFSHGRVYVNAGVAAYVPQVFRDAIETLGGEATTGVALTDPTSSSGAMQTWLFQRFARLGTTKVEASTLEIRGTPPQLLVERAGDGLDDLATAGATLNQRTATVIRTFPCAGTQGPCTVKKPAWSQTISDGERFCGGQYPVTTLTEWHKMLQTDYVASAIGGWVRASQQSCTDNPLTHDNISTNGSGRCSIKDVFPSDWQIYVIPMAPFGDILTFDQTTLEIEFEEHYAQAFFAAFNWPIAGDLIFSSGRWIMDCGHSPFKTEIHPPFLTAAMETAQRADGTAQTVADIWVNGYFPGDAISFDIWPPPRPTPDAFLTVTRPVDAQAALGLSLSLTTSNTGARVTFTAPHRENDIDLSGKMNWGTLRGYEGEWQVYWSTK